MNDYELIDRLAGTDDYPANRPLAQDWLAVVDRTVERGVGADEVTRSDAGLSPFDRRLGGNDMPRRGWNRGSTAWIAVAAAAVVIVAGAATFLLRHEPSLADAASVIAETYVATFNDGDTDALMSLFTPDSEFALTGYTGFAPLEVDRAMFKALVAWWQAQGTELTESDCSVAVEVEGVSVTIVCTYYTIDAPTAAVGAPPYPSTTTMTITPGGISEFEQEFGLPLHNFVAYPFERWMDEHHPEDRGVVRFFAIIEIGGGWRGEPTATSAAEGAAQGRARAAYAREWADYLAAAGCDYVDPTC